MTSASMMSQNRRAERDGRESRHDYETGLEVARIVEPQ